jgi:hypothetical protein
MGVSFFMYVSIVMIVIERSKTEPVSPREWRTVASFMEERARKSGVRVNGESSLGCDERGFSHELHFVCGKEYMIV